MTSKFPKRAPFCFVGLLALLVWSALTSKEATSSAAGEDDALFVEAAVETGLDFHHFVGATGEYFLPEIMGPGVALFDYDGDGDLDVFVLQGNVLIEGASPQDSMFPPRAGYPLTNRLFRNELNLDASGKPILRFIDVTERAGLVHSGYGMGVAVGDFTNNGYPDLYITNFGPNVLYRNNGNGTFSDVTAEAGVDDPRWSTSASFFDFDGDGFLDLFVVNYVDFTVAGNKECFDALGSRDYCNPNLYRPVPDRLFRNLGNGRFEDVSERAGISRAFGPGLGVIAADLNGNGLIDLYVANDGAANQLWLNQGNGTFREDALMAGAAFSADGLPEGSMGVAAGDFDNDGDLDLFMTHLTRETNTLYVNDGQGNFTDRTAPVSLGDSSIPYTGFGTDWFDLDNNGWLDLFIANGAVMNVESLRGDPYPYHQLNQLYRNLGSGRFEEWTKRAGPVFRLSEVSRGAAFGDLDNDGDIDIVVTNNNGPVRLLLNQAAGEHHWLQIHLEGTRSNRSGFGARVTIETEGGKVLRRHCRSDGSYLSANDSRVHFGLGRDKLVRRILVEWPSGLREEWNSLRADSIIRVKEGGGTPSSWNPFGS